MIDSPAVLDSDTLSEVIKGRDPGVQRNAHAYLDLHNRFQFSIITRYEILRGLRAKDAFRQVALFDVSCRMSTVLPLTDDVITRAAEIYAHLKKTGRLIEDADILIAATALARGLPLVTGNLEHFRRIPDLRIETWHSPKVFEPSSTDSP
ncbi:MAG TPA: type II toxin-antitoxin system VapC family toxin [Thermoanaerobaculia bacterium]|nr:type II toxin-antitoxin system VapC family toxin [Thermoanaerobaculia bacterium]